MDLDVYTQILMYISLSCHINNDLAVLSLFNKHNYACARQFLKLECECCPEVHKCKERNLYLPG